MNETAKNKKGSRNWTIITRVFVPSMIPSTRKVLQSDHVASQHGATDKMFANAICEYIESSVPHIIDHHEHQYLEKDAQKHFRKVFGMCIIMPILIALLTGILLVVFPVRSSYDAALQKEMLIVAAVMFTVISVIAAFTAVKTKRTKRVYDMALDMLRPD